MNDLRLLIVKDCLLGFQLIFESEDGALQGGFVGSVAVFDFIEVKLRPLKLLVVLIFEPLFLSQSVLKAD